MTYPIKLPRKLIEVALPLDDINEGCKAEKQPFIKRHPRSFHIWWARRPFVAARAVIFAQMVNDPGYQRELGRGVNKEEAERKREQLFDIIRDLVKWENTTNEKVLNRARAEIWNSWQETCELNKNHPDAATLFNPEKLPGFHDPFAGGGALPLEAQRLGLEVYASDLNPVAVTINKAMVEIPPKFAGRPPIGPLPKDELTIDSGIKEWKGNSGIAEDIRRYGVWMREKAVKRIGHLYPQVDLKTGKPCVGAKGEEPATVIAWLWARTVKSPNPAFSDCDVPLVSSFWLSTKKGKETYVKPIIHSSKRSFDFKVIESNDDLEWIETVNRKGGVCLLSGSPMPFTYIRAEGQKGRMGSRLMAVVAECIRGRVYLSPTIEMEEVAKTAKPDWIPDMALPVNPRDFKTPNYGLMTFSDLFTLRQLTALSTFTDLVTEAREKVLTDARNSGMQDGDLLDAGGTGARAYAEAVSVYLAMASSRWADMSNTICGWNNTNQNVRAMFSKQAIPMSWDFVELSPFSKMGSWFSSIESILGAFSSLNFGIKGIALQTDAQNQNVSVNKVISTDPPYYDNIGYADLSDFFYVWMRRSLRNIYPSLFSTLAVPKAEELVATPYRHGSKENAEIFFLNGMTAAMARLAQQAHPAFPVTIYYAFKQSETKDGSTSSTGWETFIEAVIRAGFLIDGTWPMRTEREERSISLGTNALASSIILVCHKRQKIAMTISRREFLDELSETMPIALEAMIGGTTGQSPIAPVDLAQAAIGPGMAIFSKYAAVLNQDGTNMSVHDALVLINKAITEYLSPDSGNFDADTLFCSAWFDQYGWNTGNFGEADTLARAKGTSVATVQHAGVIESGGGKVRIVKWAEYPTGWDPKKDNHTPVWEACHHMVKTLLNSGESASGALLARMPERGEAIRQLAYHLYTLCERKGWSEDARAYNSLITSWHQIVTASIDAGHVDEQMKLEI